MKRGIKGRLLILFLSGSIFLFSYSYWRYREESLRSTVEEKTSERDSLRGRVKGLKKSIGLDRAALKEAEVTLERLKEAQENFYLFSDLNSFVTLFEEIRGECRGIEKVSYEIRDKEGEVTINLTFNESYINLRRFIYRLESQFYFLNISYLKIQKEKEFVRGNMGINVYFRGESDR